MQLPSHPKSTIVATFQKNITYLQEHQKELYDKIAGLDSAVEQGLYQNRYELVIDNDSFEAIELANGKKFYNGSSYEYAANVAESVSLKKDENVFESFKKLTLGRQTKYLQDVEPILEYIQTHLSKPQEFEKIYKFIFFGTGLGTHIESVDEKLKASAYLIVEDDLELFRLSLFVTPYYEIAKTAHLFFSVFETVEEFQHSAQKFINYNLHMNHYIKFFHMRSHAEDKIKTFHLRVISQTHQIFFYKDILSQYLKPLSYMEQHYKFLNMLEPYTQTSLGKKPVLMLAAGPSFKKNIEWVRENQNKFIIVALSSILNTLENEGITPDIVTHMDGFESSAAHFTKLRSLKFLQESIFFLSARTPDSIISILDKERIYFYENGTSYKLGTGNLSAACVGSTTYLLLLALGVENLYLLGLDLALDATSGASHSSDHEYVQTLDLQSAERHDDVQGFKSSVVTVEGNFDAQVPTTPEFALSIDSVNATSQWFKKEHQSVYNLSEGAKFQNTFPTPIADVETDLFEDIKKSRIDAELQSIFTLKCSDTITDEEFAQIKQRVLYAESLESIIVSQRNYYYESNLEFLNSLINLFTKLSLNTSPVAYDLSLIFQEYSKFIYPYIFDFFNTKEITHTYEHVSHINELLTKAMLRIVREYIEALKAVIE